MRRSRKQGLNLFVHVHRTGHSLCDLLSEQFRIPTSQTVNGHFHCPGTHSELLLPNSDLLWLLSKELLTGRYPLRTGVPSNPAPDAGRDHRINDSETTLAEALKSIGYVTKCVGKWHLGHLPQYYPTRHGFDEYFGIPYSNDMRPVMLCRDEMAVEYPVVQSYLTQRYTAEAIEFIERNKDRNFFLYLPHAMPHKPLAASEKFYTPETRDNLYSDVIRELDWSIGQVLEKLRELGIERNTLVMFSSDNGPTYGGNTGGLRGTKGSSWEGGIRVPAIFWWPGRVPSDRVLSEPCSTFFPPCAGSSAST